jgi:hypothetical protein
VGKGSIRYNARQLLPNHETHEIHEKNDLVANLNFWCAENGVNRGKVEEEQSRMAAD